MLSLDLKKKRDLIGLDIGSHSIKLVELARSKNEYRLKRCAIAPIPPEVIVDGTVMDSGSIIEVLREMISKNRVKRRKVAISLSGYSVIIKKVSLSYRDEKELAESIHWEAAQYIPYEIEEVNLDFQILGKNSENPEQMDILLVAAKREIINDYQALVMESGLETAVIDVDSFALETMYESLYGIEDDEVVALINIGASTMNFNIVKGSISALTRDVSLGGRQITEEIQKRYNLSYEEAEALKTALQEEWKKYKDFSQLIENSCEIFATEIQRSLDFFYANYPEERVEKVILSGGGAKIPDLARYIEERVEIPTTIINPFERIGYNPKEFNPEYLEDIGPMMAVGVGLAMRRIGDK